MSTQNLQLRNKAKYFKELHYKDSILILPNAWDALSAKCHESSGAVAIATTSAGIASCFGFPDGEKIPRDLFFMMVKCIINSVKIPVSVDVESGMGKNIAEICENILQLINIGAVGINLEDSNNGKLVSIPEQIKKILAIRELLDHGDLEFFVNARIDTYWLAKLEDTQKQLLEETLKRLQAYQDAGVDGIFIPNLFNIETISQIKQYTKLPINILSSASLPELNRLKSLGISRVSTGSNYIRYIASIISTITTQVLDTGTSNYFKEGVSYDEFNKYF